MLLFRNLVEVLILISRLFSRCLNCIELIHLVVQWLVRELIHFWGDIDCLLRPILISHITVDSSVQGFVCHINYFWKVTFPFLFFSVLVRRSIIHHYNLILALMTLVILDRKVLLLLHLRIDFCWRVWSILKFRFFIIRNRLYTMLMRQRPCICVKTPS
jgi:hypothetical protein